MAEESTAQQANDYSAEVSAVFSGAGELANTFMSGRWSATGGDPCAGVMALQEYERDIYRPRRQQAAGVAKTASDRLMRHMDTVFATRGRAGGTGTPLGTFLINQIGMGKLTPEVEEVGLVLLGIGTAGVGAGIAAADAVRRRLPTAAEINEGINRNSWGLETGPGVFLWAPGVSRNPTTEAQKRKARNQGRFIGATVADVVESWRAEVISNANPPNAPSARADLNRLVGSWEGTGDWGIWQESDGYSPTSKLGEMDDLQAGMLARIDQLDERCEQDRAEAKNLARAEAAGRQYDRATARQQQLRSYDVVEQLGTYGAALGAFVILLLARRRR
jgi:hypothetical protein